ncbi:PIN-like domain-containing protein [Micromonospora rosaria]|uniref:PIN-like domain-containing protein n=1 Tax=Micromonospora rosaria TaxID=47874 RepID=UPI0012FC71F2|nr:PIN-like domain-containing protein [Micromonospora rosaria]
MDANVLLNLYRYTADARDDLLAVLSALSDRLWAPHQVLTEFWRNRDRVLRDPRDTAKTAEELQNIRGQAVKAVQTWVNRVALEPAQASAVVEKLTAGFDKVLLYVDEFRDTAAIDAARDTNTDVVLSSLNSILHGRVGEPLDEKAHSSALVEAQRRLDEKIPPGYMDRKKDIAEGAGDYLVWEQSLREAEKRGADLLFVTGDAKEDWWRTEGGERRGPRVELVNELRDRAGVRLFMVRPAQLLKYARAVLSVTVREDSLQDADRVDAFLSEPEPDLLHGGWSQETLTYLLDRLSNEAPSQALVLVYAANQGGYVTRSQVYEIAGYPEERSLRGFTRPFNRIVQAMRDEGILPEQAVDLFWAVYNDDSPAFGVAAGFQIHENALPLFLSRIRERESSEGEDE